MEKLALYDNNNKIIEKKYILRSEKENVTENERFKIVLLFIQNNDGKFLIQKTSQNKKSVYATTGGHNTYGDTSLETVIKEAKEELSIDINQNELILFNIIKYDIVYVDCYYVNKDININDITLQEEEVESVTYLSQKEIEDLIINEEFRKSNITPYRNLLKLLNEKKINRNLQAETIIF